MSKNYFYLIFITTILSINSEPYCEEGKKNCLQCNPITNLCHKCDKNIFIPDSNGGCEPSKVCKMGNNYCAVCDEKETLCQECDIGYYPDENGGCSIIPNCEISFKGECLKCVEDFILIGDNLKICKSINSEDFKNCEKINFFTGKCEKCSENFYLNDGDKKCISIEYCSESSFGLCEECNINFYYDKKENKCKEKNKNLKFSHCKITLDGEKCQICEENFYPDSLGNCIESNFCKKGNELSSQCEKCISGYFLTFNKTCTKEKNCFYGDKDLGICTECKLDFYLDFNDGKCKSNLEENEFKFCIKVKNDECIECKSYYFLGLDKKCSTSNHCVESDNGKCLECEENYWLGLDNRCTNIEKCISTYSYKEECEECEFGYYFNRNEQRCKIWEGYYENCKNGNDNFCLSCKDNYYLLKKDYKCVSNQEIGKFYKCIESSFYGDLCIYCAKGYYLGLDYKCSNIKGCVKSENGNKCYECNYNYCLDLPNNNCIDNKKIINEEKMFYYKCNKTDENGNKCQNCINGYSLNDNGLCVNDKGCKEKENNKCKVCNDNFCLNKDFECVVTDNDNCAECNDIFDFNKCTKCQDGYDLDEDNQCVEIA